LSTLLRRLAVGRVAIERGDGPLVEHLLTDRFDVVVISPRQVRSLRVRYGTAGNKDDRSDAFVLADALRTDAGRFTPVRPDWSATIALRMLVRARQDLVTHRIAVHNQLLAVLQYHFPGAVGLFSGLDIPISLAFLRRFPTQPDAAGLSEHRMAAWLQANGYCGRHTACHLVDHLTQAARGRESGPTVAASRLLVETLVETLVELLTQLRAQPTTLEARIHEALRPIPTGRSSSPCPAPAPSGPRPCWPSSGTAAPASRPDRPRGRRRRPTLNQTIRHVPPRRVQLVSLASSIPASRNAPTPKSVVVVAEVGPGRSLAVWT
jgi:hypothetical protein